MSKLAGFIGATVFGYAGWYLGALVGQTTGFILSIVGTGIGIYVAKRWAAQYLP
jgi:hypothetical protein